MKSPIRVFPPTDEVITESQLHKQFTKYTMTKSNESTYDIRIPIFSNGSLEHFLKVLMLFKQAMTDMNLDAKMNDMFREFRVHARGHALHRLNSIYEDQLVDIIDAECILPNNLIIMIAHAMTGFGRTNRLKCIKHNMTTISKLHCASQDAFMERMRVMQSYLQLINY